MLLLTSHETLSQHHNLNPTNLLLLPADQTPHDCLTLTDQLLIFGADLQEIPS